MKLIATTAIIGTLVFSASSYASTAVWFELAAGGAPAVSYGHGQVMEIQVIPDSGILVLGMFARVTEVPLYSFNTTLQADGPIAVNGLGIDIPIDGTPVFPASYGISPGPLLEDFGAFTSSGPGYFGDRMRLAVLTVEFDMTNTDEIQFTAEIGNSPWLQSDSFSSSVAFGSGDYVDGSLAGAGGDVVVSITKYPIPEPSTISFLVLAIGIIGGRNRRH